jgi:hypothetical protein
MIKYNLKCKCGKDFDSWFLNSSEFDSLQKKKLIKCIYCDSSLVEKSVMSPHLPSKSNKIIKKNKLEKNIKNQLISFRKYIEKNFKYVGENFTQEARTIHYDKKKSKAIYGKATKEDTKELIEEGIEVSTIPWVDKTEN